MTLTTAYSQDQYIELEKVNDNVRIIEAKGTCIGGFTATKLLFIAMQTYVSPQDTVHKIITNVNTSHPLGAFDDTIMLIRTIIATSGGNGKIFSNGDNGIIASSGAYTHICSSGNDTSISSSGSCHIIASSGKNTNIATSGVNAKIVNWSWETSYDGTAHGEARIVNTLPYSISGIKYVVIYYDRSGNYMAEDDGRVSKTLNPNEKYNFTFWSSNAKSPSTANLKLDFSDKTVYELMKEKPYTGKEFEEFVKNNKD